MPPGPRLLAALGVGAVVAHLTIAIADPGAGATGWLINATFITGAALCLWRSTSSRRGRIAWACVGAGLLFQALADRYYKQVLANQAHVSQPSLADFGYLAFYPFAAVAIVLLLRSRVTSITRPLLLDAAVVGLAVMAAVAAFVLPDVLSISGGNLSASLTNVAYPIADLLLLGLLAGGTQLLAGKPDRALVLIGVALILFITADSIYLYGSAAGTYSVGGWVDSLWCLAAVLMGIAAWQPALRYHEFQVWRPALRTLVAITVAAVAVSAILVLDSIHHLPAAAIYLTVATFLASLARLVVAINSERAARERLVLSEARYQDLALHDPLTGLANRSLFDDRVAHLFSRRAPAKAAAFIMVDIDHFKEVNDSLGHGAGDELLIEVARRLVECVRPEDTVARLGGDEFCIVLAAENSQAAVRCGERIVTAMGRPFALAGAPAHATASVGIAVRTSHQESANDLQQHADQALYRAKAAGRGRSVLYDPAADVLIAG
jgi:diguanylate cyclase (GGDEF)-like protein